MKITLFITTITTLCFLSCGDDQNKEKSQANNEENPEAEFNDDLKAQKGEEGCFDEHATMINPKTKVCKTAENSCLIAKLSEQGFRRAEDGECTDNPGIVCSAEFAIMYNPDTDDCQAGNNGCVINSLMSQGYRKANHDENECKDFKY